jgi:nucleoid-associated protein YgaU
MKTHIIFTALLLVAFVFTSHLNAQPQSKEEWQHDLQQAITQRDDLKNQVAALEKKVNTLRQRDASLANETKQCQDELYSLLGRSGQQAKEFGQLLNQIDARINALAKLSDVDLHAQSAEVDSLKALITRTEKRPLALIPENMARLQSQQQRVDGFLASLAQTNKQHITYVVGTWKQDRDCLWNIAAKPKIYDNAFLWPKIWEDNRGQIKNPDLIYKGQRLSIPLKAPLTAQETRLEHTYFAQRSTTRHKNNTIASAHH